MKSFSFILFYCIVFYCFLLFFSFLLNVNVHVNRPSLYFMFIQCCLGGMKTQKWNKSCLSPAGFRIDQLFCFCFRFLLNLAQGNWKIQGKSLAVDNQHQSEKNFDMKMKGIVFSIWLWSSTFAFLYATHPLQSSSLLNFWIMFLLPHLH